jgi:uncharacterized protein
VCYAICGSLVYWARKWKPLGLLTLGFVLLAVPAFNYWLFGASLDMWPTEALEQVAASWKPGPEEVQREVEGLRGNYFQQMPVRAAGAFNMQTFVFLIFTGWRSGGFMLVGMGLFKLGILSASRNHGFYAMMLMIGFVIGFYLVITGVVRNFDAEWDYRYSMFLGYEWNYIGSIFVTFGYLAKVMIWQKMKFLTPFKMILCNVGRMAFSNYILMTILCTFIFYGHGLGMFGRMERTGQMLVVAVVWIIVIIFSTFWLKRYLYGPLEWLWRSLTYGQKIVNHR